LLVWFRCERILEDVRRDDEPVHHRHVVMTTGATLAGIYIVAVRTLGVGAADEVRAHLAGLAGESGRGEEGKGEEKKEFHRASIAGALSSEKQRLA
jgi:hypothetical protein